MTEKIDRTKINLPNISLTSQAWKQITLIAENDFTLEGQVFRVQIAGKGCDGFTYALGITAPHDDDFKLFFPYERKKIILHLDPFTAFYLQNAIVDYQFVPTTNEEGFVITNLEQEKFSGKFWKDQKELVPPTIEPDTLWV